MMPSSRTAAINSEVAIGRRMKMLEKLMGGAGCSSTPAPAPALFLRCGLDLGGGGRRRNLAGFHRRHLAAFLQPELARGHHEVGGLQTLGDDQPGVPGFTAGGDRTHRDVSGGLVVGGTACGRTLAASRSLGAALLVRLVAGGT